MLLSSPITSSAIRKIEQRLQAKLGDPFEDKAVLNETVLEMEGVFYKLLSFSANQGFDCYATISFQTADVNLFRKLSDRSIFGSAKPFDIKIHRPLLTLSVENIHQTSVSLTNIDQTSGIALSESPLTYSFEACATTITSTSNE